MRENLKLDEFDLINKFSMMTKTGSSTVVGIGDDAAVLKSGRKGFYELLTCDAVVENIHFRLGDGAEKIGYKAVAVNVSDIAAMGGIPKAAVITAGIPGTVTSKFCEKVYSGIISACNKFSVEVVGGDIVKSRDFFISVAMTGIVEKNNLVLRKGAVPGDIIMVTGNLGYSPEGKHLVFTPRVKEARYLVKNFNIHSLMDISDGLAGDLRHICNAGKCGAVIYAERVPVNNIFKEEGRRTALRHALVDGEDFELLFTVPENAVNKLERDFNKRFKIKVSRVGRIIKRKGIFLETGGKENKLSLKGFRHF